MRLLWIGDAADTGFGTVTRELGRRLLDRGHDVRFVCSNMDAEPLSEPLAGRTWDRARISTADLGTIIAEGFRGGWKPEQAVLLADYQLARDTVEANPEAWTKIPVWHHVPIEGIDLPPSWARLWSILRPVAITRFGAAQISLVTHRETPWIYHGVDHALYRPASAAHPLRGTDGPITSRREAKANFGIDPDAIVLLRADRHMPRKGLNAMIRAVAPILTERDDVELLIHCRPNDYGGNLEDTLLKLPGRALAHVRLSRAHDTWHGVRPETLAGMYNSADVYLNTGAEGFGLTLAEALACGVPVVGLDYSAVPEVVGPGGVLVPGRLIDNIYDHYWATIDEAAYTAALWRLIDDAAERSRLGTLGREHVSQFSWDVAAVEFEELFESACEPASTVAS